MADEKLVATSRWVTFFLAIIAFGIGIGILLYDK